VNNVVVPGYLSAIPGQYPGLVQFYAAEGSTSTTIYYGLALLAKLSAEDVGMSGDVAVGLDIFHGQQGLWGGTAAAGNALGAATAAVVALPVVIPAASTAVATGIGWSQAAVGAGGGVVLGSFPAYLRAANAIGANAFNVGGKTWGLLSYLGETWTANRAFLGASIFRGQQFWLSESPEAARYGSYFASELQYLTSRGINPALLPIVLRQLIP
jgi:hypothetical protein